MKLSLLIPTTPDRHTYVVLLRREIARQVEELKAWAQVEVLLEEDNYEHSIGWKRNMLLQRASGEYLAFIDSDDRVANNYLENVMKGIDKGADCCSLRGIITFDGRNGKPFIHSMLYNAYTEDEAAYYRYPNHLNCMKASIAKQFKFPEINHGEDTDWATQIHRSGLLKTEYDITDILYYYDWRTK